MASNLVVNNVLCYLSTARHSQTEQSMIAACQSFYKYEDILDAKETLYGFGEETITKRRGDAKARMDITDMIAVLQTYDEKKVTIPTIVCDGYNKMPPASGFEILAEHIVGLMEEMHSLKEEISKLNAARSSEEIKEELSDIKKCCNEILKTQNHGTKEKSYAAVTSVSVTDAPIVESSKVITKAKPFHENRAKEHDNSSRAHDCGVEGYPKGTNVITAFDNPELLQRQVTSEGHVAKVPTAAQTTAVQSTRHSNGAAPQSTRRSSDAAVPSTRHTSDAAGDGRAAIAVGGAVAAGVQGSKSSGSIQSMSFGKSQREEECNNSNEPWVTVVNRRRKQSFLTGAKKTASTLKGVQQTMDLYVGRCDPNVTDEHIRQYILEEFNFEPMNCECISREGLYVKAFKVAVGASVIESMLDEERWPENVRVRRFQFRRQQQWR